MANQVHKFKDRDIRRLVRAARAAGLTPTAIEVDTRASKIKVITGKPDIGGGDLDEWLEEHRESPAQGR
jgi:hypothetical protein